MVIMTISAVLLFKDHCHSCLYRCYHHHRLFAGFSQLRNLKKHTIIHCNYCSYIENNIYVICHYMHIYNYIYLSLGMVLGARNALALHWKSTVTGYGHVAMACGSFSQGSPLASSRVGRAAQEASLALMGWFTSKHGLILQGYNWYNMI